MSRSLFRKKPASLLFTLTLIFNVFLTPASQAAYTCEWFKYKVTDTNTSAINSCNQEFLSCEKTRISMENEITCTSKCNSIGRIYWCDSYEGCVLNIKKVTPGTGEEKYMKCVEACKDKTYQTPPDCVGELKACCETTKPPSNITPTRNANPNLGKHITISIHKTAATVTLQMPQ